MLGCNRRYFQISAVTIIPFFEVPINNFFFFLKYLSYLLEFLNFCLFIWCDYNDLHSIFLQIRLKPYSTVPYLQRTTGNFTPKDQSD